MYMIVRNGMLIAAAVSLAACSASQSASAPLGLSGPASVPAPVHGRVHRFHRGPHDVTGGGMKISMGDVALPNGSGIKAVNVGIDQIIVTDLYGNQTTVAQYSTPEVINVMAYQNGNTTPIGQGNVAETTYASMTIVVDTASSNILGGASVTRPIAFENESTLSTSGFGSSTTTAPYGPGQVAITFNSPFQTTGSSVSLDVDFNVMESILPGRVTQIRPSLTVAQQGYEGSIAGNLTNASGNPVTNAVVTATDSQGNIDASTYTDSNGNFLLHTLTADTYTLTVYNQYVSATGWTINAANPTSTGTVSGPSVTVTPGQTSQVGTIAD
jgi:Carboxypeptidase regulatory-like domain/Domain of unknown function (DUF4382)